MEQIYIILKSLSVNEEEYYESVPSTFTETAEAATELLQNTLKRLKEWYSDLEVLGQSDRRLHVRYTDDDGAENNASYWVDAVRRFDRFAW